LPTGRNRRFDQALADVDAFGAHLVPLTTANRCDALMASGTIPIICDPVKAIHGAPKAGTGTAG